MTKKRKSVVEREADQVKHIAAQGNRTMPTPEETTRIIKNLVERKKQADADQHGPGRPQKQHDRERFTTIIDPALRAKVKIIAARDDRQIHDVFNEAVAQYVERYEKQRGEIDL